MMELYKAVPVEHIHSERALVEFLEARFAEDRATATGRELLDLESKRYILGQLRIPIEGTHLGWTQQHLNAGAVPTEREYRRSIRMMKMLAFPYKDHADWRPEWTAWKAEAEFREEW